MTVYYELTNELAQFYNSKFVSISDYPNRILDRCSINSWIEVGGDASTVKIKIRTYDRLRALEILARMDGHMKEADAAAAPNVKVYVGVSPDDWDVHKQAVESRGGLPAAPVAG